MSLQGRRWNEFPAATSVRRWNQRLTSWGLDLRRFSSNFADIPGVWRARREYEQQRRRSDYPGEFEQGLFWPILESSGFEAGAIRGHYFHQDLLVARAIFARNPRRHIDVGSSITGFVSHVASFREIEVLDIRPLDVDVPGIKFRQVDMMDESNAEADTADSVSCLHALEHFGLGRYGDSVDYGGWRKGFEGLTRLLERGGHLYLSVPSSSRQRVEFNAQRIFSIPFLLNVFDGHYDVVDLSFVDDAGNLHTCVDPAGSQARETFNATYGCSIWTLRKI